MVKLTKTTLFKASKPAAETVMDKTTRVVREMLDEETEQREIRTARLRTARLEREAVTPKETAKKAPKGTRKKPPAKAV
ncbi:hypothetical protein PEL8287_03914 [Roseovarius litorisediminis]|uniref:Uncharacterized protein n=1 Tax=Roseovarius litorisediminis TaxID=1312363 RepID=A0A1Y5TXQ9_9RHOB|nr:hypothetical protein [Roseovarius litorisediminis]SLN70526.1 hypothetical protein PEL8287_03914 [Roseovarius litorisediminis]